MTPEELAKVLVFEVENPTLIVLTREYYDLVLNDKYFLMCLEMNGVDNWDGYEQAVENFKEMNKDIR